jgi:cytochrome c6
VTISKLGLHQRPFPNSGSLLLATLLGLASHGVHAADVGNGNTIYEKHCLICHGPQGAPTWPGTPDFRRGASLMKPDAQLLSAIRYGKGPMPGYLGLLKESDVRDVTAYLRTLSR